MSVSGARAGGAGGEDPVVLLACVTAETPSIFDDDVPACCALCGTGIYHRPRALDDLPAGARAACLPCAARYAREHDREGQPATFGITARTLDEVAAYLHEHRR